MLARQVKKTGIQWGKSIWYEECGITYKTLFAVKYVTAIQLFLDRAILY